MLTWIRDKFGTAIISVIIGGIALVFVFYGVFSPKSTRGLGEGAVAGTVNGDSISLGDFNRELQRRMAYFKNMFGGKFNEEQFKGLRIREGVFQELVQRKLMVQEADREGMVPADDEVRDRIREIPAFQKEGKFDLATYKQVLEANGHTPASFERLVREDISQQLWETYFRSRVHVSDEEVKREFLVSQDQRNIKYVLLTSEAGKRDVVVNPSDVAAFLKDPAKLNLIRSKYESGKDTEYKNQSFEIAQESIARGILAGQKMEEVQKANQKIADQVLHLLSASKSSDTAVNAFLKKYAVQVKSTGLISQQNKYIPGVGEATALMKDAFLDKSPIDGTAGGKAKIYNSPAWTLVAIVTEKKKPDLAKFDSERGKIMDQMLMRKEGELREGWIKKLAAKAKIDPNPAVLGGESEI